MNNQNRGSNRKSSYSRSNYSIDRQGRAGQQAKSRINASAYSRNAYTSKGRSNARKRSYQYGSSGAYTLGSSSMAANRKSGNGKFIIIALVVALLIAAGVFLFFNPPFYSVTVNGNQITVSAGTTIQKLIDEGHASPVPGNLLAVDGSMAQAGKGNPFEAIIDGSATNDPDALLHKDAVIEISNGSDLTETYTEKVSVLPYETSTTQASQDSYYFGSIHLYSSGVNGEQSVKTGDVSGKTVTTITKQPIKAGYSVYKADVGNEKVIALTFDDGPWPTTTKEILQILEDNGAHATFFVIGEQVEEYADTLKQVQAAGNQIATHSYDHASGSGQGVNMTYMSSDEQIQEVTKGIQVIENVLGVKISHIMRAPGGNYYGALVENLASYIDAEIGWDVDTHDWSKPGAEVIEQRILSAQPGDVILCHDGGGDRSQTVEALRSALPQMVAQGYKFVTIDELLSYGVVAQ